MKRRATRRGLSVERLEVHPNRFRWPERRARQLGRMADREVAALAGVSREAVIEERRRRGIPAFRAQRGPTLWTEAMLRLLGTDTDVNVAAEIGIKKQDVFRKRRVLGIPSFCQGTFRPSGFQWTPRALALLGTAADSKVARRLGVSKSTVLLKRLELEIPPCHAPSPPVAWSREMLELLGKVTDQEVHRRFEMAKATVKRKREALGIPPTFRVRFVARTRGLAQVLKLPNPVVRARFGIAASTLGTLRRELGIAAPPHVQDSRWAIDALARLGKESDRSVARSVGLSPSAAGFKRRSLGIPAHNPKRRWTGAECRLLGRIRDAEIAWRLGRSLVAVQLKRRQLGVPRLRRQRQRR